MTMPTVAVVPPQAPLPQEPPAAFASSPGRALTGWMRPDQTGRFVQTTTSPLPTAADLDRAHQAVAARPAAPDRDDVVTDVPDELAEHVRALQASPAAKPMHDEGWKVALVDLTRVCAFQPAVVSDRAIARVQAADKNDLASLAAITLPLTQGEQVPPQYDPIHQIWSLSSANHNLRIVTAVSLPASPIGAAFGFIVVAGPSFMQVGCYHGRHFLRDGYHRAFGLLSRGITAVPAFVREISVFEELVPDPRTMLPQDTYQGPRPPFLTDYLDDTVSAAVQVPDMQKTIIVQGLELFTPVGQRRLDT